MAGSRREVALTINLPVVAADGGIAGNAAPDAQLGLHPAHEAQRALLPRRSVDAVATAYAETTDVHRCGGRRRTTGR